MTRNFEIDILILTMRKIGLVLVIALIVVIGQANAGGLYDKIRAAQCDITVFAPAINADDIQWSALLHLNQQYGAEIHIAVLQPAPEFNYRTISSDDGQFHLTYIGRGAGIDDSLFADTVCQSLFHGIYPDIAVIGTSHPRDSAYLVSFLSRVKAFSENDVMALTGLQRIYIYGEEIDAAAVVLNDEEFYQRYKNTGETLVNLFDQYGPQNYGPKRFRRYFSLIPQGEKRPAHADFISGFDTFRLPDYIMERLIDGPQRRNVLNRLDRYRSYMRAAGKRWTGQAEQLRLLGAAYQELGWLLESIETDIGELKQPSILDWTRRLHQKALLAVTEALGLDWTAYVEMRETPFGPTAKLTLDMDLTGSKKIELSYFKFHPPGRPAIVVDSISKIIEPHQKFYRQYPINLKAIDLTGEMSDSLLFSLEIVVEGLPLNLFIPYREYVRQDIELKFLPGYAFLSPFTQDDITALAQPFDWQIMIGKPFGSELTGILKIITPEAVVVGSYDKNVYMPKGTTRKYMNIYLAAGRSIADDRQKIKAELQVGGQVIAKTDADVRILQCRVPETRDIAYIPDKTGQLEDFLRMIKASCRPFTQHSLIRASLEAYDVIIIGTDARDYYSTLKAVSSRLRDFVKNGGEIIIFGQPFGWPADILEFPIYTSRSIAPVPPELKDSEYTLFNKPYKISPSQLTAQMPAADADYYPAIINAGQELITAGEHGSYLKVTKVNEGHFIYCGLPLLDMVADLNAEAIYLLANLISFENGK